MAQTPPISNPDSILHLYKGAFRTLKQTSRATNANWYRESRDMPVQWHILINGNELESKLWIEKDKAWYDGPDVSLEQLQDPAQEYIDQIVPSMIQTIKSKKDRAVGIILHLSDSISLAEIQAEFAEERDFDVLDDLVRIAPNESISGTQINQEEASWSLLPYWGESVTGRNAIAFQIENQFQTFVELLSQWGEMHNTPVNVSVTAAPREALSQLPLYLPQLNGGSSSSMSGCIAIFRYRSISFITALNSYSELCSARILPNRGSEGLPADLEWVIKNYAAAEDIENPVVCLLNMAGPNHPVPEVAFESPEFQFKNIPLTLEADENKVLPIEFLNPRNSPKRFSDLSSNIPKDNQTFPALLNSWAGRTMYTLECQNPTRFPSQRALGILRGSRFLRLAVVAAIPAVIGWCLMGMLKSSQADYWKVDDSEVFAANEKVKRSTAEKKNIEYWENLMASRSEGWVVLSSLLEIFPEGKEIFLTDCKFNFHSLPPEKKGKYLPMRQTWTLKGFATQKGVDYLTSLSSRSPMVAQFNEIAKWSESSIYESNDKTRSLNVVFEQRQAPMASSSIVSKSTARLYRKGFELKIEREFSDKDEIAMLIENPFKSDSPDKK